MSEVAKPPPASKVLIATPTAQGDVTVAFAQTLLTAVGVFSKAGFAYRQAFFDGPDIALARNAFANAFLADAEATHLLFIDSDMSVSAEIFARLIAWKQPIAAAIYSERALNLDKFADAVRSGASNACAAALASNFVLRVPNGPIEVTQGFCKLEGVGFGCILIERTVFETMIAQGAAPKVSADKLARHGVGPQIFDFFSEATSPETGRLSEDYSFCRRARAAGFEIWGYAEGTVGHVGQFAFTASFYERLMASAEKLR